MLVNQVSLDDLLGQARRFSIAQMPSSRPGVCASNVVQSGAQLPAKPASFRCMVNPLGQFRIQVDGPTENLNGVPVGIKHCESGFITKGGAFISSSIGYLADLSFDQGFPDNGEFEIVYGNDALEPETFADIEDLDLGNPIG